MSGSLAGQQIGTVDGLFSAPHIRIIKPRWFRHDLAICAQVVSDRRFQAIPICFVPHLELGEGLLQNIHEPAKITGVRPSTYSLEFIKSEGLIPSFI
jgi:hypothetical protein